MKKFKLIYISIISIVVLCSSTGLKAQQLPHFRNPYFNLTVMNPSSISIKDIPEIMLNHRSQWIGFLGAPKISTLSGKYQFHENMGAGAYIMNDNFGLTQKLDLSLSYAYLLKTEEFYVSFGLAWTLTQYKIKGTEISIYNADDLVINQTIDDKMWKPDANAGIMIYNNSFYAGISAQQLFRTKYTFFQSTNDVSGLVRDHRHFTVSGGYNIRDSENQHKITPFTNLYFAKSTPFKFDAGFNYVYNSSFLSSLYLSKGDALVFSAGYKYDRFYLSYSFDFVLSRIKNVSSGAHEICIGIYLQPNNKTSNGSSPMF